MLCIAAGHHRHGVVIVEDALCDRRAKARASLVRPRPPRDHEPMALGLIPLFVHVAVPTLLESLAVLLNAVHFLLVSG